MFALHKERIALHVIRRLARPEAHYRCSMKARECTSRQRLCCLLRAEGTCCAATFFSKAGVLGKTTRAVRAEQKDCHRDAADRSVSPARGVSAHIRDRAPTPACMVVYPIPPPRSLRNRAAVNWYRESSDRRDRCDRRRRSAPRGWRPAACRRSYRGDDAQSRRR